MKPSEFWPLTYAELIYMLRGYNRRQINRRNELIFVAWHAEMFARQKSLPALSSMITDDEPQTKVQTDDEMMTMCKILNAAFGGEVVET